MDDGNAALVEPIFGAAQPKQSDVHEPSCVDEDQLITLAKTQPQVFGLLYDRYYSRILNYIFRRTLDVTTAEELTSNAFFKALRALPDYSHQGKFGAWLYRIAGNEVKLHWRARQRRQDTNANWQQEYARVHFAANHADSPEDFAEQARQFARLHDALTQLPERYQTVLSLRYFEGMSYDEVACVLEKRLGSVKSLIHRGLERLRRQLQADGATLLQVRHCHMPQEREP